MSDTPDTAPNDTPRLRPGTNWKQEITSILNQIPDPVREGGSEPDFIDGGLMARLVKVLVVAAINMKASELQIEPDRRIIQVRVRVDGRLHQACILPAHLRVPLTNRFKVMADMNFWHLPPQSGTIRVKQGDNNWNIGVQTVRALHGEQLHLHLVPVSGLGGLSHLGMLPETHITVEDCLLSGGLFLIVGPPNSGKTRTAFTLVNKLNDVESTVASVEEMPTHTLPAVVQTYRNRWPERASAQTLVQSLLRQHTNFLFCGDLSDEDMTHAALDAAENGVTTFACVTANTVAQAIARLLRWGIAPERLAQSLSGVLFQTLVGTVCPDCREAVAFDAEAQARLDRILGGRSSSAYPVPTPPDLATIYRGKGCEACNHTGIRGRMGLFGCSAFDDEARLLLQTRPLVELARSFAVTFPIYRIEIAARSAIWDGKVSLDELERVLRPLLAAARRVV